MDRTFQINGSIEIYKAEEIFLGMSQYQLLKLIVDEGSINAAAKRKGMSYQQAWNLIDQLNKISPIPIVIRQKGGAGGGGCFISPYGLNMMKLFEQKLRLFQRNLQSLNEDMNTCML